MIRYAKYTLMNGNVLKDGHTMFLADVLKDLERKSWLEEHYADLQAENDRLRGALCAIMSDIDTSDEGLPCSAKTWDQCYDALENKSESVQ